MAESLAYIDVNPNGAVKNLVVWMHGLGDSGHGFAPLVPELKLAEDSAVRFIFPHAPERPVTINNGLKMRAWYDIGSFDFASRADQAGVLESASQLQNLIDAELAKHNLGYDRLILAGFSQGGVMAYHLGCRLQQRCAGILALSCYMAMPEQFAQQCSAAAKETPVLAMHGRQDEVVPIAMGQQAANLLTQEGFKVTWREYPMQHNLCSQQIEDLSVWLTERLD